MHGIKRMPEMQGVRHQLIEPASFVPPARCSSLKASLLEPQHYNLEILEHFRYMYTFCSRLTLMTFSSQCHNHECLYLWLCSYVQLDRVKYY